MKFGDIPTNGKFGHVPEIGTGDSALVRYNLRSSTNNRRRNRRWEARKTLGTIKGGDKIRRKIDPRPMKTER